MTIVADLQHAPDVPDAGFDCIICTQTLQYLPSPNVGVATLARLLKPGGTLLLSVPALSPIDDEYDTDWLWMFTAPGLRAILDDGFAGADVTITGHGNLALTRRFLDGTVTSEVPPRLLTAADPRYPIVITAVVRT